MTTEVDVTSFHPGSYGGGILVGQTGSGRSGRFLIRVRIGPDLIAREPRAGETWRVTGTPVCDPVHGEQVEARLALPLLPTGGGIQRWIATNPKIPGVGAKTASRLWEALGTDLYDALKRADVASIAAHVGPRAAQDIVNAFRLLADEVDVLAAYDRYGVDPRAAVAACALWGREAIERLARDPYAIAIVEPWVKVDERALRFGVMPEDHRRMRAAVMEVCSRRFSGRGRLGGGHMAATRPELADGAKRLLGTDAQALVAIDLAIASGDLVALRDDLLQSRACRLMEQQVAKAVADRVSGRRAKADPEIVTAALRSVEADLGLSLELEQRAAVAMAVGSGFSVVDGGAGTGKSTITRAISRAAEMLGRPYLQMALSGRAAKRLHDATGREAMTIHRFIKGVVNGRIKPTRGIALVDEASMLGTPDLWQVLGWLPVEVDVVLVGDPAQLPPISAGNPFPKLVSAASVPRTTLRRVHRQGGDSDIPTVADAIRRGCMPRLPDFDPERPGREGVFLIRTRQESVADATLGAFAALVGPDAAGTSRVSLRALHGARVQVLGATIEGPAGVRALSDAIEARWLAGQQPIHDWGLSVGSKILWTHNSYDHRVGVGADGEAVVDIMNGSLGIVQRPTPAGACVLFDDADATLAEVRRSDLQRVARGWAVTVHKAQGSGFERVIVPVTPSRLLDRQLLYTAVTRAARTAVLVGDEGMLAKAVAATPLVQVRRQALEIGAA